MEEEDKAEQQIKELKEQGYKTFAERDRKESLKQALRDYDRYLSCPYE